MIETSAFRYSAHDAVIGLFSAIPKLQRTASSVAATNTKHIY